MPFFTTLTQQRMCHEVAAARHDILLAAPSISLALADALIAAHQRLCAQVLVVLDVSATVCRLGYGSHEAVERLVAAGVALRQQSGLRLGVLICDRHGWSFAGAPLLVEADPQEHDSICNAVALTEAQILALRAEFPAPVPHQSETSAVVPVVTPMIGQAPVELDTIRKVKRALEIAAPQPFDLARQTRVYNAFLQFVELEFEGFNLQSRRVQLPKSLPVIASKDRALKQRLSASLKMLEQIEKPESLLDITARLEELRKAFLLPVGRAGRVVLKSKRAEFEQELAQIEVDLEKGRDALKEELKAALDNTIEGLVPDLARAVLADPPPRFRGLFPLDDASARIFVREELQSAFPNAEQLVQGMQIHKFYKDVTYETLKNDEFEKRVKELIPKSIFAGALLEEDDAAKTRKAAS